MNNNEAKRVILEADSCFCKHGAYKDCHSGCKYREALDAAVKALEQEPTTKNNLGVDKFDKAINQSDLEEWIMETFPDWCEGDVRLIMNHMDEMPPVTPQEPKTGHWKVVSDGYGDSAYICECSECKDTVWVYKDADRKWNYCPNCGAKMVEPQESEEKE